MENLRFFSSSSQSETLVPSSTLPRRSVALAANSRASASEVLPAAPCPTSATVRISFTLNLAIGMIPSTHWRRAGGVSPRSVCFLRGLTPPARLFLRLVPSRRPPAALRRDRHALHTAPGQ